MSIKRLLDGGCRVECGLVLLVIVSYAYFYNGAQWNHNSRLDTIFAFVEPGTPDTATFRIDRFIVDPDRGHNTGDWSTYRGHYYSNKAPGPALLGIPVYFGLFHLERMVGVDPTQPYPALINAYLLHLAVTVLPMALSAAFFFRLLLLLDCSRSRALWGTVALYWGTLFFPFSTQLWGHTSAAAFVVMAIFAIQRCLSTSDRDDRMAPFDTARIAVLFGGFTIGLAVLCEYSCALLVPVMGIVLLFTRPRFVPLFIAGGVGPFIAHAIYHYMCFGSVFTVANVFNNPIFLEHERVGGLFGLPSPARVVDGGVISTVTPFYGLTFSPYRGLFFYMPHLLLAIPALSWCLRHRRSPIDVVAGLGASMFLLMNLTFNGWFGGWAAGPRYQIPVLSMYVLLATALPSHWLTRVVNVLTVIPACASMLLIAMLTPMVPQAVANPIGRYYAGLWKVLTNGDDFLQPYKCPIRFQSVDTAGVAEWGAFNWGEQLLGVSGVVSVVPWLVGMTVGIYWLHRLNKRRTLEP